MADRIIAEAGDGVIWLDWSDGYRIIGERCRELAVRLSERRPAAAEVVSGDNVEFFEYSSLLRWLPS